MPIIPQLLSSITQLLCAAAQGRNDAALATHGPDRSSSKLRMIGYFRSEWYGLAYLFKCRGSVMPKCLPYIMLSSAEAVAVSAGWVDDIMQWMGSDDRVQDFFDHPFGMQLLGLIFGYLSITRMNITYNRYWSGVNHMKDMFSKWLSACRSIIAIDRATDADTNFTEEPFCRHIVQLFCQLSAMAMMRLHVDDTTSPTDCES